MSSEQPLDRRVYKSSSLILDRTAPKRGIVVIPLYRNFKVSQDWSFHDNDYN